MSQQPTVLEFLEESKDLPRVMTVDRTQTSKYVFYLLVRHYRRRLMRDPIFFTYEKKSADAVKSMMEEHSIFNQSPFYILEGFSQSFVDNLDLTDEAYCVAETDGGTLKADSYSHRLKREILKILLYQLNLKLSLRALLALDWSSCRNFDDYEVLLRKTKAMGWTEEQVGEQLKQLELGQLLTLIKRSQFKEVFAMVERYGPSWTYGHMIELLYQLIHFRALRAMGYEDDRAGKELEVGYGRIKELADSATMLSVGDIKAMIERIIKMDRLIQRNPGLGLDLLMLNSPARLRK